MVMAVRQCNTEHIAQCSMTSASPEPPDAATGGLITLYHLVGRQGDNQHNNNATCTHFAGRFYDHCNVAVLYQTHHPMEEEFVAFIKPTKYHHRASTRSDITQLDTLKPVDSYTPVDMLAPNKNRGVTYQTDENHISKTTVYLGGVVH